jgi:hypothetical protein
MQVWLSQTVEDFSNSLARSDTILLLPLTLAVPRPRLALPKAIAIACSGI